MLKGDIPREAYIETIYMFEDPPYFLDGDELWSRTEYPGIYISNTGIVYNSNTGHFLQPKKQDKAGHLGVSVRGHDGRKHYPYVHRLIARGFIPNDDNLPIVRHLNDIPYDNEFENLCWGTYLDNHMDCVRNGHYKPFSDESRERGLDKVRRPVIATDLRTGERFRYRSICECARDLGLQTSNIDKVIKGTRKHTRGYFIEYEE